MKRQKQERVRTPENVDRLIAHLIKAVVERAMQVEMTEHLGYMRHDPAGENSGNSRNGATQKTLIGDFDEVKISIPRDRNDEYQPLTVRRNQTRWTDFDEKILSMYCRLQAKLRARLNR